MNALSRFSLHAGEGGAQDFVTTDNFVEGLFQGAHIERTAQAKRHRQNVCWVAACHLLQQPKPLLGKGKRQLPYPFDRLNGWWHGQLLLGLTGAFNRFRQFCHRGGLKNGTHSQRHLEGFA